jgi:hypothetical protein
MTAVAPEAPKARVAVWGKGFRVTQDTEEFQRWVPRRWATQPNSLVAHLDAFDGWASLLQSLYQASERDLALLRCVLFDSREAVCCAFAKSEDKHKRPTVIVVSAAAHLDWSGDVTNVVRGLHALASRLAVAYANTGKGNPDHVGQQLKQGTFLANNDFELGSDVQNADDWDDIVGAVKEWNGITGVASPKLVALGANVVIGTQHEAELAQGRTGLDGYYDVRDRAIHALTTGLTRWAPRAPSVPASAAAPKNPEVPPPPPPSNPELVAINESIQELNRTVLQMANVMLQYVRGMQDFVFGDPKK